MDFASILLNKDINRFGRVNLESYHISNTECLCQYLSLILSVSIFIPCSLCIAFVQLSKPCIDPLTRSSIRTCIHFQ